MSSRTQVEGAIRAIVSRSRRGEVSMDTDTSLFSKGLGLGSLETVELFLSLKDDLGADPFQAEQAPQTVGDLVEFYDSHDEAA